MRLYFMRHGQAVGAEDWSGEPGARPLTQAGRERTQAAAHGLATLRPGIGAIISSPYARAYETALIVGRVLNLPVTSDDDLTPRFDLPALDHALSLRPDVDGPLFVGHEPNLSDVISALSAKRALPRGGVVMHKASCCLIETPDDVPGGASVAELAGRCMIAWIYTWRELAALANEDSRGR